ncbi:unnamed protein product, partial [Prorocentrum cordatum]
EGGGGGRGGGGDDREPGSASEASPAGLAASPLGPPPGPAPLSLGARPLTRPMCAAAGRPGGEPRPMLRGPQRVPHGGPAGLYHDMLLPCGLFQEEAIDIMFRELSPDDFEMLAKLDEHLPKRNIVQRTTVDTLPQHHAQDCDVTECGVCLVALEPTTRVSALPCGHAFHPHCIARRARGGVLQPQGGPSRPQPALQESTMTAGLSYGFGIFAFSVFEASNAFPERSRTPQMSLKMAPMRLQEGFRRPHEGHTTPPELALQPAGWRAHEQCRQTQQWWRSA